MVACFIAFNSPSLTSCILALILEFENWTNWIIFTHISEFQSFIRGILVST